MSKGVGLMMWGFTIEQSLGDAFYKKDLYIASVVRHPGDQLLMILVLGYYPEKCVVEVLLEG